MNKLLGRFVIASFILLNTFSISSADAALSATPSAAQIEQFKKLPKSQQMALAKQFGVDINALQGGRNAQTAAPQTRPEDQYLNAVQNTVVSQERLKQQNERSNKNDLKPFGYEMFDRLQDAFLPDGNIPIPGDYIVGPGDNINISLFGKESNDYTLEVNNEGNIIIPGLEPLPVSGLSYKELKAYIANTVKTKMIGIKSAVTMAGLRGVQVYVVGDVKNPGAYYLSSLSTLTNALFISGGPSKVGSLRNIQLKRAGQTVAQLDLYKLFSQGDVSQDQRLQQGDVVFVGTIQNQVAISGEVRRPAIYETFGNETVADLIDMAGGLNVNAYPKHAILARFDENYQRDVQRLNLNDNNVTSQLVKNGDVITVLPVSDRLDQVVNVAGSVSRPTTYAWSKGMTIADLISNKDDLMETTDLNYGLILSQKEDGQYVVKQFKPSDVLSGVAEKLIPGDLVVFFNRYAEDTFIKQNAELEVSTGSVVKREANRSGQIEEVFDTEYDLTGAETKKKNYLYAIQNGSLFDKQDALLATKYLSRQALITPIVQLVSNSTRPGELIPIVEVTGQVKFPGIYPLAENSKIANVIMAAGGLNESANLSKGEVSRLNQEQSEVTNITHIDFNLVAALSDVENHNIDVKPRDVVNIFQQANWNDEVKVQLTGEVMFPGTYTVKENETLSDVIKRAGGLTKQASPEAAFFSRQALKELEVKQARDMARSLSKELAFKSISSSMSTVNIGEVQTLVNKLTTIEGVGRLIIDLPEIINTPEIDIVLEDGDRLFIPSFRNEVNVVGEVQVATSHLHNTKWDMDDYIQSSGGLRMQSDADRVYIVRANGLVDVPKQASWFSSKNKAIVNPGDTIVVPLNADYTDKLTLWEKATGIFYNSVIALAASKSAFGF